MIIRPIGIFGYCHNDDEKSWDQFYEQYKDDSNVFNHEGKFVGQISFHRSEKFKQWIFDDDGYLKMLESEEYLDYLNTSDGTLHIPAMFTHRTYYSLQSIDDTEYSQELYNTYIQTSYNEQIEQLSEHATELDVKINNKDFANFSEISITILCENGLFYKEMESLVDKLWHTNSESPYSKEDLLHKSGSLDISINIYDDNNAVIDTVKLLHDLPGCGVLIPPF